MSERDRHRRKFADRPLGPPTSAPLSVIALLAARELLMQHFNWRWAQKPVQAAP